MIFNFNGSSKKALAKFSVISFIVTGVMIYFMSLFKNQLGLIFGIYSYTLLFLIAFILIFTGYILSKEKNFKNSFKKVLLLSYMSFMLIGFVCIMSNSDLFGFNSLTLGLFTTILFNLLIWVVFYAVNKFNLIKISYNSFGRLYFICGVYLLIVSLFLPNIMSLDMKSMKPINIASIESMIFTIVFLIVVAICGLWYYKKNTLLK
ncbi:DUF2162 family putative transporter [Methanobrevibacter sp.]|uniref:DUF2162 family putative transporter n=1 Tax=Methanobrevibacter sp. TaxID=66852 RepID=UPI00388E2E71